MKWTGGTSTADPPNVIANPDGTATVTIISNNQVPVHVALTNTVENALGNFTVTKKAIGDFPDLTDPIYATVQIPFTYSYTIPGDSPVTGQTFVLNQANNFAFTSRTTRPGRRSRSPKARRPEYRRTNYRRICRWTSKAGPEPE